MSITKFHTDMLESCNLPAKFKNRSVNCGLGTFGSYVFRDLFQSGQRDLGVAALYIFVESCNQFIHTLGYLGISALLAGALVGVLTNALGAVIGVVMALFLITIGAIKNPVIIPFALFMAPLWLPLAAVAGLIAVPVVIGLALFTTVATTVAHFAMFVLFAVTSAIVGLAALLVSMPLACIAGNTADITDNNEAGPQPSAPAAEDLPLYDVSGVYDASGKSVAVACSDEESRYYVATTGMFADTYDVYSLSCLLVIPCDDAGNTETLMTRSA